MSANKTRVEKEAKALPGGEIRMPGGCAKVVESDEAKHLVVTLHTFLSQLGPRTDGQSLALINDSGLTLPQILAMHTLLANGPMTVGDVALAIKLSRAATSHLVERLVRAHLVLRVEDEHDRRHKQVSVSPKGLKLMQTLWEWRSRGMQKMLDLLTEETRRLFGEAIERASKELEAQGISAEFPHQVCKSKGSMPRR